LADTSKYSYQWSLFAHPDGDETGEMQGVNTAALKLSNVRNVTIVVITCHIVSIFNIACVQPGVRASELTPDCRHQRLGVDSGLRASEAGS